MGDTIPKDVTADLDAAQKAQAVRKTAYYKSIMAARDAGHPVTLHLVGSPKYLLQENGRIEAPYCAVSLDETALAP